MKLLVIGSKGFIGSHCIDYFSSKYEVWGCDVIIEYDNPNYLFIEATESDFSEIFQLHSFDVCINCSGAANVSFSLEKPLHDFQLNTLNVYKILESIRRFNPKCRFVNMSSAAVYGNPKELPIAEKHSLDPVSPYGLHKKMAEQICKEYFDYWNIKTCNIRVFSAYGPRLKKQLLWDISQKIKNNSSLSLFGTGKETRDFIYITDLISIIELVILESNFEGDTINAANGFQISIKEIAKCFVEILDEDINISFNQEVRMGDPLYWEADVQRIKSMGYISRIDIFTGIKNYITWLKENKLL